MPSVGFEPTILVSERPKTHALDRRLYRIISEVNVLERLRKEAAVT
jgi:hypothetical protein